VKRIAVIGGASCNKIIGLIKFKNLTFLPRHGNRGATPAHLINHQSNIGKLKSTGIKDVIGICSVGSLKAHITPEHFCVPDDYICLWSVPTIYKKSVTHITPHLDETIRGIICNVLKKLNVKYLNKGIYAQTTGPRLETRAEIKMLSNFADIVGMTMASEATIAVEMGLRYASLCIVDNYANGIVDEPLDAEQIFKTARDKAKTVLKIIEGIGQCCL
jgi:5'-methylthioadenosine phosphorylase